MRTLRFDEHLRVLTLMLALFAVPPADAQSMPMRGMDHGDMKGMDHEDTAPASARDPDAYSDGLAMRPMNGMDMADDAMRARVLLDRLELFNGRDTRGQALDAQAWFGTDLDKLWIKVDGERDEGRLGATRTEALWDRAVAPNWSLQVGVRHDFGSGPGRNWAALGVPGLAPYWFDVQATAYVGDNGRTALRFEPEYDLTITQRLILQANAKLDSFGKNDPQRRIGAGVSSVETGLRMRYEISRKFAPYLGVVFAHKVGNTARYAREDGDRVTDLRGVVGVRIWF
jgi:copper resistance protein B